MLTMLTLAHGAFFNNAWSTVVQRASLKDLVRSSQAVLHAQVVRVDDTAQSTKNRFLTTVELRVIEAIKGLPANQTSFSFTVPGGRSGTRALKIPGMPVLKPHQEVVLLLEKTGRGEWIYTGFSQGVFEVAAPKNGEAYVKQTHSDVLFVGKTTEDRQRPHTLHSLLKTLRSYVRDGDAP